MPKYYTNTIIDVLKDVFSDIPCAGLNDLINQGRHRTTCERWFYLIAFISSVILSLYFVSSGWMSFQDNPTAISLGRYNFECPWMAITICPVPKFKNKAILHYIKQSWGNLSQRQSYYYNFLLTLANFSIYNLQPMRKYILDPTLPEGGFLKFQIQFNKKYKVTELHGQYSNNLTEILYHMATLNFEVTQGELGLCYCNNCFYRRSAFEEWETKLEEFEVNLTKKCANIQNIIYLKKNDKVYVHLPYDIPKYHAPICVGKPKRIQYVKILLNKIIAGQNLETLSLKQRQCHFPHENPLSVMPWYAVNACLMQCRHDFIVKYCDCSPHIYRQGKEKVCGIAGLICMGSYHSQLMEMITKFKMCPCLSTCDDINYSLMELNDDEGYYQTCVFKHDNLQAITFIRDIVFSDVDMLASWGGAVSSLLGISVVNFIETLYLLLRGCFVSMRMHKKLKVWHLSTGIAHFVHVPKVWKKILMTMRTRGLNKVYKVWSKVYKGISQTFREWLDMSSLHGVKYINDGYSTVERTIWFIMFNGMLLASYWVSIFLVEGQAPILYEMQVSQLYQPFKFPSIETCPRFYFEDGLNTLGKVRPTVRAMCLMQPMYPEKIYGYVNHADENKYLYCEDLEYPDFTDVKKIYEKPLEFIDHMISCKMDSYQFKCSDKFHYYKTERGPCFAFNSLQTHSGNDSKPLWKAKNTLEEYLEQEKTHFSFIFNAKMENHVYVTLSFHFREDVPGLDYISNRFALYPNIELNIMMQVRETIPDIDVQQLSIEARNCHMPEETLPNSYYPLYSYSACEAECRARLMLHLCGCIHPMSPYVEKVPLCSYEKLYCLQKHIIKLLEPLKSNEVQCTCRRDCLVTDFKVITDFSRNKTDSTIVFTTLGTHDQVRLRVTRGDIETFVTIGGVCGLFFGASVMSFVEMFLFSVFRLLLNIYQELKKKEIVINK